LRACAGLAIQGAREGPTCEVEDLVQELAMALAFPWQVQRLRQGLGETGRSLAPERVSIEG
jgi:hypothetical protein